MAGNLQRAPQTRADRRSLPRSGMSLGVTLHRVGEQQIIPAAIANLSASGFLAEIPAGESLPEHFEVDLPNAGRRQAQVVWSSGQTAGCNFAVPLSKADLSAARLKSDHRERASETIAPVLDPADPIWDVSNEALAQEKLSPRSRVLLIAAAGALPWLSFAGIAALLV